MTIAARLERELERECKNSYRKSCHLNLLHLSTALSTDMNNITIITVIYQIIKSFKSSTLVNNSNDIKLLI